MVDGVKGVICPKSQVSSITLKDSRSSQNVWFIIGNFYYNYKTNQGFLFSDVKRLRFKIFYKGLINRPNTFSLESGHFTNLLRTRISSSVIFVIVSYVY